jgi:hypothetical protein
MKRHLPLLATICALVSCGGTATSFGGVWGGSFTAFTNDCPFPAKSNINPLFPLTVSIDENDVYTVRAVDGSVATGGQGSGETISFLTQAPTFGNFGSIAPYTCETAISYIGFIEKGTDKATVTLQYKFTNCQVDGSSDTTDVCSAVYTAEATRIQ